MSEVGTIVAVAQNYINECVNNDSHISEQQKSEALNCLELMLKRKISADFAVSRVAGLIGTPEPALKVKQIMEVDDQPLFMPFVTNEKRSSGGKRHAANNWTTIEDNRLLAGILKYGLNDWKSISIFVGNGRTKSQCSQRWFRGLDPTIVKSPWTYEEEKSLLDFVAEYGEKSWKKISTLMKNRSDAQCRYHYMQMQKGKFSKLGSAMINSTNIAAPSSYNTIKPKIELQPMSVEVPSQTIEVEPTPAPAPAETPTDFDIGDIQAKPFGKTIEADIEEVFSSYFETNWNDFDFQYAFQF